MSASTAAAPSASAEIYDTDRFGELYYGSRAPSHRNLGLAARFMISLFQRHNITFALLGGWAVFLRGGGRSTEDVDFTVATTMDLLKKTMMPEQRLCIPKIHGATSIQVFVHTGGAWDPTFRNARPYTVSVDIIIGGNLNTPPGLPDGSEQLRPVPETTQGRQPVPVISIFYQLMTKLSAYSTRRETGGRSDFIDLNFLVRAYGTEIYPMRHLFDLEQRWIFYNDFAVLNDQDTTAQLYSMFRLGENVADQVQEGG